MKNQVNARLSMATRAKLDALNAIYGTQAEVLAVAIDRLWASHFESRAADADADALADAAELNASYAAFLAEAEKL